MTDSGASVLLIDPQFLIRTALKSLLESQNLRIAGSAATAAEGIRSFQRLSPTVTILDLRLPDASGFEVIKSIRSLNSTALIVVLTNHEGPDHLRRASQAGASAYLTKDVGEQELIQAIREVLAGKTYFAPSIAESVADSSPETLLTARQLEVLKKLSLGLSNRDIGVQLGIAEKTVRVHMGQILAKMGAADRTQAVVFGLQRGIVDLPQMQTRFARQQSAGAGTN